MKLERRPTAKPDVVLTLTHREAQLLRVIVSENSEYMQSVWSGSKFNVADEPRRDGTRSEFRDITNVLSRLLDGEADI